DGNGCVFGIAHFLQADDIGIELSQITMDRANLAIFFVTRCIGPTAGKPLDVPKGRRDCGRRTGGGERGKGGRRYLRAESAGEESNQKQSSEKSGGHGNTVTRSHR